MQNKRTQSIRILCECAIMVTVATILDLLCGLIPGFKWFWGYGGSISIGMLPLAFISFRHGWKWGGGTALVYAVLQMILGFYAPPVATFGYFLLCILLDYVIGFSVLGLPELFMRPFGKHRLLGYGVTTAFVNLLRFISSFFSGVFVFNGNFYVDEGAAVPSLLTAISDSGAWIYSLSYNGSYMLANMIINPVLIVLLCAAIDPKTLHRPQKD